MLQVLVEIVDFFMKAATHYVRSDEGAKEWNDIIRAANMEVETYGIHPISAEGAGRDAGTASRPGRANSGRSARRS